MPCIGAVRLEDAKALTLPAIPYFWFSPFADFSPDATCSPCLCWKSFAVDAALLRSEADTLLGSSRRLLAVRRAACFSAHVVPVVGAGAVVPEDDVDIWENLFCNPPNCGFRLASAGGATDVLDAEF